MARDPVQIKKSHSTEVEITAMSSRPVKKTFGFITLLAFIGLLNGCAYFKHRGNDALDFLDIGVTVTDKLEPDLDIYFDFFSFVPVGFSRVDGKFYGLSRRRFGQLAYTNHSWGVVVWGRETRGIGEFDPNDPYDARPDQKDLTERPRFDIGLVGLPAGDERPPWRHYFECNRGLHLGWVGVDLTCRISELFDFVLGWTTLDIMGDDK